MNKRIKILDCTLRDGGRIIDCKFPDEHIKDITEKLSDANIDIIELGFIRNPKEVTYNGNSTFFTKISQLNKFIPQNNKSECVAFIDYSMYDFEQLEPQNGTRLNGLRIGFTKNDFINDCQGIVKACKLTQNLGYKLYIQGVNSLAYTDSEFLKIIEMANEINPDAFAIVDTYGAMYEDDLEHIFRITHKNLNPEISIDFHSHNNFQLSFALAQKIIKLSNETSRNVIIDATLEGMGKCAGNLNLELITDFLTRKYNCNYDTDKLLDIIDDYTYNIKQNYTWGYSIPSVMAAIYQSHPNNVIYLTEKFRLATKDIKYILSMIPAEARTRYDYDRIKDLYIKYNHTKVEDTEACKYLKNKLEDKEILILAPGHSLLEYKNKIKELIQQKDVIVIPVNFISNFIDKNKQIPFFGSAKRYQKFLKNNNIQEKIVVSNILEHKPNDILINYESLIERNNEDFDTSMIMLLNLLHKLKIEKFMIAGFDGFVSENSNYFDKELFEDGRFTKEYDRLTQNTIKMLKVYTQKLSASQNIRFVTPSIYEKIFNKQKVKILELI